MISYEIHFLSAPQSLEGPLILIEAGSLRDQGSGLDASHIGPADANGRRWSAPRETVRTVLTPLSSSIDGALA